MTNHLKSAQNPPHMAQKNPPNILSKNPKFQIQFKICMLFPCNTVYRTEKSFWRPPSKGPLKANPMNQMKIKLFKRQLKIIINRYRVTPYLQLMAPPVIKVHDLDPFTTQIHENTENIVSGGPPRGPRRVPRRVPRRLFRRPEKRKYNGKRSVFGSSGSETVEIVQSGESGAPKRWKT